MMRAARFHGKHDIRIEEIPIPVPKDNEVLIQIEWCGICGTDLHEYTDGPAIIPRPSNPHFISQETLPVTMGHEFCGIITKAPPTSSLKVGQPVMVDPRLYCSNCYCCRSGNSNACLHWGYRGLSGCGGGLSEYVAALESVCIPLPENADLSVAALIEPLAVACHAVRISEVEDYGDLTVLVLGGGPIGAAVMTMLRLRGARRVFVSEPTAQRQGFNKELAEVVLNPKEENVAERCREMTSGEGVDVVFDCAGVEPAMRDGMNALKYAGVYVNVAGWITPFNLPQGAFMTKELKVRASLAYNIQDIKDAIKAFADGLLPNLNKFVTGRVLLEDVVEKGLKELVDNKDEHVKILVTPKREYLSK